MGYTSKYKGAEIDALLDKVEALPEGGGEGGSAPMMIEVTWEELVALRDAANLTAGQMYRITDYETMTSKEGSQAAGHPFDIIVTALDNKTLDEKASAIWSARDTEGYFANSNLPAWDVRYCLDNDKNRFDWAVVKGKTLKVDCQTMDFEDLAVTMDGTFEYEGVSYFKWSTVVTSIEIWILTTSESPSEGEEVLVYLPSYSMSFKGVVSSLEELTTEGKGVIYYMGDESGNDAPYDFKNILFLRKVTSEGVVDEETGEDTWVYTFSLWEEGVIKEISKKCIYNHIGKMCWDNVFLSVAPFILCAFNEIAEGSISNTLGPNVTNNRITFGGNNKLGALCMNNHLEGCSGNILGDGSSYNRMMDANRDNIINGSNNILEASCKRNTVNGSYNSFAVGCEDNDLKLQCHNNRFGSECKSNILIEQCERNIFETYCSENTLNESCSDNIFHIQCKGNVLGKYSWYNSFGAYCTNNKFGESTTNIVLGNLCSNNKFATTSAGDTLGNYFKNIVFGGGCKSLILWCAQTTSSSKSVKNIRIAPDIVGTMAIEIPVIDAQYVQTVAKNSSGEIKVYCEADLVQ